MKEFELLQLLAKHDIPIMDWGKGEAKTLDHLLREVEAGECQLKAEGIKLIRHIYVSSVYVYYNDGSVSKILKEDRQVFADGRVRRRNLEASLNEKIGFDENPLQAARRALKEELGIQERFNLKFGGMNAEERSVSPSYPGLLTTKHVYHYTTSMREQQYKSQGYIEQQEDKTNYYVWIDV